MPYEDERENLLGHRGLVSDEDIEARLRSIEVGPTIDTPSSEELGVVSSADIDDITRPPSQVVAVDGSRAETPVDAERINAQVGFVEISIVTVDSALLRQYKNRRSRFVPPTIEGDAADAEYVRMVFPSQNAHFDGEAPKPVGFRRMLYENFCDSTVRGQSLLNFLTELLDQQDYLTGNILNLENCPYRDHADCPLEHDVPTDGIGHCDTAGLPLYPTDRLRIHEYVSNRSSNISALTVVMKTVEHLALGLAIDDIADGSEDLADTAFMKDGPLAQFDTAAWISRGFSNYLHSLRSNGNLPIVIGLDKTGDFARFGAQIRDRMKPDDEPLLPSNSLVPMSSNFIYDRVKPSASETMFGRKTYYGKSFIYKSPSDYMFCVTVGPREFRDGATNGVVAGEEHDNLHHEPSAYPSLGPALAALFDAELALYEDSVIPIHMAHDRATIPQKVGDKVLSELVERELLGSDRVYGR